MDLSYDGFEIGNDIDPRISALAELNEARRIHGARSSADSGGQRMLESAHVLIDTEADDISIEDLMPTVLPVTGVLGALLTIFIAILTAGAVYAARSILFG